MGIIGQSFDYLPEAQGSRCKHEDIKERYDGNVKRKERQITSDHQSPYRIYRICQRVKNGDDLEGVRH